MSKHPLVEFVKYVTAIILLCLTRNPYVTAFFLVLELTISFSWKSMPGLFGMTMLSVAANALVNHQGETYLFYLNDNIVTMESLIYGAFMGVQLWLLCRLTYRMGRTMTSEKIVIVFKYVFPPAAIVLSMAIRSINRYTDKLVEIYHFQMSMEAGRGLWSRMISSIRAISILINWALENGLEIADAMECRAYGSRIRTSYTPFRLLPADVAVIAAFIILVVLQRISEPLCLLIPRIEIHFGVFNALIMLAFCTLLWWQTEREKI
ncbi:MAG: energy-coupling factor transporter transmembrane component T [Eubacterium sp.]